MKSITVFCAASSGVHEIYEKQANLLGQVLAKKGIRLVYGGAKVGLMGAVADGALSAGGEVVGVLPKFLQEKELAHEKLTELVIVNSMHERKLKMNDLCDGVIALPGAFGTLEELFEMFTWAQLGLHEKPVAILNINGFYDSLNLLTKNMVDNVFLKKENRDMLLVSDNIEELLQKMATYKAPEAVGWITKEKLT